MKPALIIIDIQNDYFPGGKMELAMQLIFTPFVWRMMERQKKVTN